jgi:chromosome segregation ATPase
MAKGVTIQNQILAAKSLESRQNVQVHQRHSATPMAWFSLSCSVKVNKKMENSINQESRAADPQQDFAHRSKKQPNAEFAELHEALREKEKLLQANEIARQEMALSQQTELRDLKNQLIEKDELLLRRQAELHSLKFRLENLSAEMSQIGKDKDRMISEVARLNAELKEKRLILAKQEQEEWQSIGWRNELKRKLGKLGARFSSSGEEEKQKSDESYPLTSR